ncbi:hypothetical protein [Bacillus amyloliquefaciens]|uniref:hypothetical protein n=1 Tax=Bacillus amyloliquefaciens TaxID=1390 RepID=UPI002D80C2AB|nr:hypothetical protein [Bacillus amyloliquefaciens]MEB4596204.1 hypothetical protein [Bacillus amyloliquefaciens]
MNRKIMLILTLAVIVLFLSLGIYFVSNNKNKAESDDISNIKNQVEENQKEEKNHSDSKETGSIKENKYYIIYIKQADGTGASFVPEKLNPGFSNDSDFDVNISFDDNGDVINDGKIIEVNNFLISNSNKKRIKEIVGAKNYNAALKEVEGRVLETKKKTEEENSNTNT